GRRIRLVGSFGDGGAGRRVRANLLVGGGMRTVQTIGVPAAPLAQEVDAVVVALKSRTIPPHEAVAQSLAALGWLRQGGCQQIYFKYCSTFDSTPKGNIGPVSEALMEALGTDFTIACPAFPEAGRTICRGHLFVGDALLSESGMKEHPLTPMTDANLVRVLQAQTRGKVGLIRYDTLARGAAALGEKIEALRRDGVAIAVADALSDQDLIAIAEGCEHLPLITAGSGVGLGIALNHRRSGRLKYTATAPALPRPPRYAAVLSGSCSVATNGQVAQWMQSRPALRIDPLALAAGQPIAQEALNWARSRLDAGPVLVYATANPQEVQAVQDELGTERA